MRPTKMPRQQLGQIMTPDCSGALEDSGLANCRRCALPRVIAWQSGALPAISKTGSGARPGGHPLMKPDCRKDCGGVTGAPRPQRGASGDRGSLARDESITADITGIRGDTRTMSSRSFRIGRSVTGLGLFATKPIKRGAYIATYRGRRITTEEADRREVRGARYQFE